MSRLLLIVAAALALAPAAAAGGPTMLVGAAEDSVRQPSVTAAKAQMTLFRLAGLNAVRMTAVWAPGRRAPVEAEGEQLAIVEQAARLSGLRVLVQVMNAGSRTTPLTAEQRGDFAAYAASLARRFPFFRDFVIGNEPNLNRFWLPQFALDGSDAAAPAYLQLLAETYDALKAVSPSVNVIGGALAPRGEDKPNSTRHTHSPTAFILDLGAAYRASGRSEPVMDQFAMHAYQDNSSLPPSFQHPRTTTIALGDYGKLVALLGRAFDGTAQLGSTLPIVYDEFGVESQIPQEKADLYSGTEPPVTRPVDEAKQAAYYREALELSFCQPNAAGFFIFHTVDERARLGWQSGLFYADETAKSGLAAVAAAVRETRGGVIQRCPGLELTPVPRLRVPRVPAGSRTIPSPTLTCDIDCSYVVRFEKLPRHATVVEKRGRLEGRRPTLVPFAPRRLARGSYRFTVRVTAPVNVGPPGRAVSRAIRLG
ncbi:MAG: hypothetical protein ABR521_04965 [Gaiellaceae bacterium]